MGLWYLHSLGETAQTPIFREVVVSLRSSLPIHAEVWLSLPAIAQYPIPRIGDCILQKQRNQHYITLFSNLQLKQTLPSQHIWYTIIYTLIITGILTYIYQFVISFRTSAMHCKLFTYIPRLQSLHNLLSFETVICSRQYIACNNSTNFLCTKYINH